MEFLTNWTFWIIIAVIVIIMAIIGYLAEGTELDSKSKKKPKEEKEKEAKVEEIETTIETNEPSAWTGEIKKDERHEQVHDVPSMDDWTNIPTDLPSVETMPEENIESVEEMAVESAPVEEPVNPQILQNLDAPLTDETVPENTQVLETTKLPAMEEPKETIETFNVEENIVVPENTSINNEQLIEPAPIFDMPVQETVQTVIEEPQAETLEVTEENKQETNADDIWK